MTCQLTTAKALAMQSRLFSILGLLIFILAPSVTQAQGPPGTFDPNNFDPSSLNQDPFRPSFGDSRDRVRVGVIAPTGEVARGSHIPLAFTFDLDPTWHIWPNQGNLPEGMVSFSGAVYTEIKLAESFPEFITPHTEWAQWPTPHGVEIDLGEGLQNFAVYEGWVVTFLPITIADDAPLGEVTLKFAVAIQACDDNGCLMPVDAPVEIRLTITEAGEELALVGEFEDFDPTVFERIAAGETPAGAPATTADATRSNEGTAAPRPTFFGLTLPSTDGVFGLILLALFSAIGGFILNLTPCVLPVIPIKIMTIMQHANKPGKNLVLGLWMAIGVVTFWVAAGLPMAVFRSQIDPSQIFGIWWVTTGIGIIIALMGLGIMGLFMIQLPQSVYMVNPKADNIGGSFLFGVMTAVLGLPCFGFVAGALLAGAAAFSPARIMLIFTALGVGMAAPYLILSAKPSLVERIPRTGPASELVKQVMGFMLFAAAAYFIGSGLIGLVSGHPYLARLLHWWIAAAFIVVGGLWLVVRTFKITPRIAPRMVFLLIGLLLGATTIGYVANLTRSARIDWEEYQAAIAAQGGSGALFAPGVWNRFTPAAFEKARDEGYILVLDFTAEWCLNCKALKATVLKPEPVRSELRKDDVVNFTVDLTDLNDPGWEFLRELGHTGIPVLAIYTPGVEQPWTSTGYTAGQVLTALSNARTSTVAQR